MTALSPLFGFLGFVCVLVALAISVSDLARKLAAERRLRARMSDDPDFRRLVLGREEVLRGLQQDPPDPRFLSFARAMIEAELDELSPGDRKRILHPLRQPSVRSQASYMMRLLRGTGAAGPWARAG